MSRGTLDSDPFALLFVYRALTFYGSTFQSILLSLANFMSVLNPIHSTFPTSYSNISMLVSSIGKVECMVWALPSSLAATGGISFDYSSSGYLDVSVPRVPSSYS